MNCTRLAIDKRYLLSSSLEHDGLDASSPKRQLNSDRRRQLRRVHLEKHLLNTLRAPCASHSSHTTRCWTDRRRHDTELHITQRHYSPCQHLDRPHSSSNPSTETTTSTTTPSKHHPTPAPAATPVPRLHPDDLEDIYTCVGFV